MQFQDGSIHELNVAKMTEKELDSYILRTTKKAIEAEQKINEKAKKLMFEVDQDKYVKARENMVLVIFEAAGNLAADDCKSCDSQGWFNQVMCDTGEEFPALCNCILESDKGKILAEQLEQCLKL